MDTATKTYYSYGYKIVRRYHYVDAHQHYDYIVKVTDKEETFTSLANAKKYISNMLHGRKI